MSREFFASLQSKCRYGMRIVAAATYSFFKDDCYTKAAVLTFYTLQFIIPFLALVFGIAKAFGFDQYLENLINQTFSEQKEITNSLMQIALSMLSHSSDSIIVGIGIF